MDLPIGTIIMWDGGQIPAGWVLCDGDNGTIETRGVFIRCASADADLADTGGGMSHFHTNTNTSTRANHNHGGSMKGSDASSSSSVSVTVGSGVSAAQVGHSHGDPIVYIGSAGSHSHTVPNTKSESNLPKSVQRAFIMKVA